MRPPQGPTLRGRLVVVALVALVPMLVALLVARARLVAGTIEERTGTVRELAELAAREHRDALRDAETHFRVLGHFAASDRGDGPVCSELLPAVHAEEPHYTALALYRLDGSMVCRHPEGDRYDLSDTPYFLEAVRSGRIATNDYHLSPDGIARASLAYPVVGPDGSVDAVIVGGVDLSLIPSLQRSTTAEPGLRLLVLEADGTVLMSLPEGAVPRGARAHDALIEAVGRGREGVVEAPGPDGSSRRYAVVPLGDEDHDLRSAVAVGFDLDADRFGLLPGATASLVGLFLSGLVMLGGIWAVLELGFVRRLAPVLTAARRFGAGDLAARTGVMGQDEVGMLAATFDDMAQQVAQARRAEAAAAQRAIEARDARFRLLAETIDEAFWIFDEGSGTTEYLSPGYEKIWGRAASEAVGPARMLLETVHPEDLSRIRSVGLEEGAHEYRILRPDGEVRWVRSRIFTVRNASGAITRRVGVAQDITEQRRLEEALVRSSKLEAVGRLAGGVAHDFNNILMAVRGHVQLLEDSLPPGSEHLHDLAEIDRAALRAERLTRQLLAFGRKQPLSLQSVDICHAVADTASMLERLVGEDVLVVLDLRPDTPGVRMDPSHLEQILVNLAVNARDAMPGGGTLRIHTGRVELDGSPGGLDPGVYAELVVSDDGSGMSEDVLDHVFEPFFTTKEVGKGTGLGLATVWGVVQQARGEVRVASEPGHGACFTIHLPAEASSEPVETTPPAPPSTPGRAGSRSVLVVEDEEAVRRVTVRTLAHLGYEVVEAEGGRAALDLLDRHAVDVVLSDVLMPDMTGPQLAGAVRAAGIDVPIVLMSGYPGDGDGRMEGLPLLRKPFSREALVAALDAAAAPR